MPKLTKAQKSKRDRDIIKGIPRLLKDGRTADLLGVKYTAASLAERFHEHLRAMAHVRDLYIAHRNAVKQERDMEAKLQLLIGAWNGIARGAAGKHDPRSRAYGVEPERKPYMSAATKRRANEKRQKTRQERGIVGKRRRARMKGG